MLAIDPAACVAGHHRAEQLAHAEKLFARILEQDGTRLPSDRRFAARMRTPTEGVVIPKALHEQLLGWSSARGVSLARRGHLSARRYHRGARTGWQPPPRPDTVF